MIGRSGKKIDNQEGDTDDEDIYGSGPIYDVDVYDEAPFIGSYVAPYLPSVANIPTAGCMAGVSLAAPSAEGGDLLSDPQKHIISTYFDSYFKEGLENFITVAVPELHSLRAFLIVSALFMPCELYRKLFNQYYPLLLEHDSASMVDEKELRQNSYFRELLFKFNNLCKGGLDINEVFYTQIFDKRIDNTKSSHSPTKKRMVTQYLKNEVEQLVVLYDLHNDLFVQNAIAELSLYYDRADDILKGFGHAENKSGIRRQLFGTSFQ